MLFVSAGTLYAQGFDLTRLALTGNRSTVAQDVASVSVSDAGIVAYRTTSVVERRQFVWFDRAGREIGRVGDPDSSVVAGGFLSLSPNGRHVAMHRTVDQNRDIWLLETTRGVLSRFTSDAALDGEPQWSPNGQQVVFCSNRSGVFDLYVKSTAAPEGEQLLLATAQNKSATDWSLDGRFILFRSVDPTLSHDLWALPLDGDKKPFQLSERASLNRTDSSLQTDSGSLTNRMNRVAPRCTSSPFQVRARRQGSPRMGALRCAGGATARNCSTWRWMAV